jgi:hypothetical protein
MALGWLSASMGTAKLEKWTEDFLMNYWGRIPHANQAKTSGKSGWQSGKKDEEK